MSQNTGVQEAAMRCVLCGGPFWRPTQYERLGSLSGQPSSSFRWLESWYTLPANVDKRRRGEPAAFYAHRECVKLVQQKLNIQPQHCQIWPFIQGSTKPTDSMPDCLPSTAYLGIEDLLAPHGSHTSATMLSPTFNTGAAWMLHSPCVCTQNARRILTIWQPKLDSPGHHLAQRLATLALQSSRSCKVPSPRTPTISAGGAFAAMGSAQSALPASAQPDLLTILLAHPAMHDIRVITLLQLSSKAMSARMSSAVAGRLKLRFRSCSTEAVMSFSAWLHQHAALLQSLELGVSVSCCKEDEAAADAAIAEALAAAPRLPLKAFSTTCSKPQLLTHRCQALPCLQSIIQLTVPDLPSAQAIRCLPHRLQSLDITASTAAASGLQAIAQSCPKLSEVRLGYNMWPSRSNTGPVLLDHALNGWPLLPLVELRFIGVHLPQSCKAHCPQEPPYMSKAALSQLGNLRSLTRLVFEGCCVDAPVSTFMSVVNKMTRGGSLQELMIAQPSGVLTVEGSGTPRCFVDITEVLLQPNSAAGPDSSTSLSRAVPAH